jgi:hypothetical protein
MLDTLVAEIVLLSLGCWNLELLLPLYSTTSQKMHTPTNVPFTPIYIVTFKMELVEGLVGRWISSQFHAVARGPEDRTNFYPTVSHGQNVGATVFRCSLSCKTTTYCNGNFPIRLGPQEKICQNPSILSLLMFPNTGFCQSQYYTFESKSQNA